MLDAARLSPGRGRWCRYAAAMLAAPQGALLGPAASWCRALRLGHPAVGPTRRGGQDERRREAAPIWMATNGSHLLSPGGPSDWGGQRSQSSSVRAIRCRATGLQRGRRQLRPRSATRCCSHTGGGHYSTTSGWSSSRKGPVCALFPVCGQRPTTASSRECKSTSLPRGLSTDSTGTHLASSSWRAVRKYIARCQWRLRRGRLKRHILLSVTATSGAQARGVVKSGE